MVRSNRESRIPPHTHCKVCGRSIPLNREFCSNECREKYLKEQRRAKKSQKLMTIMFVVMLLFLLIISFMRTGPS